MSVIRGVSPSRGDFMYSMADTICIPIASVSEIGTTHVDKDL